VFGIDPGSTRTGYGCIESDGRRHRLVCCGAITLPLTASFPDKLHLIHTGLASLLREARPDCVAVENVFHAANARSALLLGHARGVILLAAVEAGLPVAEYTPAEVKRAVVGYGRAEKAQVQQMIKLLLGLDHVPSPHDVADALAIAVCHLHQAGPVEAAARAAGGRSPDKGARGTPRSWRQWRPAAETRGAARRGGR
jgi:crossover junction endodeoxyribonuclease RuvC